MTDAELRAYFRREAAQYRLADMVAQALPRATMYAQRRAAQVARKVAR